MPIYEYICKKCGLEFQYLVYGSQSLACPSCNHQDLRKLISSFAFSFKDSRGNIAASSSRCSGCASHNCSSCAR